MRAVTAFFRFCFDFIVGDDWTVAAAVVAALAVTALVSASGAAWLVLPAAVLTFVAVSLARASRKR